jgi:hypothetical protein
MRTGVRRAVESAARSALRLMQLLGNSRIFVVSFMVAPANWDRIYGPDSVLSARFNQPASP